MQIFDHAITQLKTLKYSDIAKFGVICLLALPVISLWKAEEYLSKNNLPPYLVLHKYVQIKKVGTCQTWIIKVEGTLHYTVEATIDRDEIKERKVSVTFTQAPSDTELKETCKSLTKFAKLSQNAI
jgi:hypothetical protein